MVPCVQLATKSIIAFDCNTQSNSLKPLSSRFFFLLWFHRLLSWFCKTDQCVPCFFCVLPFFQQASSEAEETLKRIQSHRGVTGILIVNKDGVPIKSTLSPEDTVQYAALITQVRLEICPRWLFCRWPVLFCCGSWPVVVLYCLISHPCVLCVLLLQLASKARSVIRTLDPQNDITFLRVRSKKHEIMVAPDKDYLLFVIQNPNSEEESSA